MTPKSAVTASNMINILVPSTSDITLRIAAQSKGFGGGSVFESAMMILCNTRCLLDAEVSLARVLSRSDLHT
jgi:hypothetical protein